VITNAVRYAETKIVIKTEVKKQNIDIWIYNDGPNVPDHILPQLFDRFYKGDKGQSGLGLAIVQKIIVDHQGEAQARNYEGGFGIHVSLPYLEETEIE
jgi:signal transduction histidine kinase